MKNSLPPSEFPRSVTLTVGDRGDIVNAIKLLGKTQAEAEAASNSILSNIPGSVVRIQEGRIIIGGAQVYEGLGVQGGVSDSVQRSRGKVLSTLSANDNNYFKVSNS